MTDKFYSDAHIYINEYRVEYREDVYVALMEHWKGQYATVRYEFNEDIANRIRESGCEEEISWNGDIGHIEYTVDLLKPTYYGDDEWNSMGIMEHLVAKVKEIWGYIVTDEAVIE